MVKKLRCSWRSFVVAALLSALASTLIVAVGPGFSSPNDNAAEQAQEATAEGGASQVASTEETAEEATEEATEVTTTTESSDERQPHSEAGNPNASSVPDTHGHVGSGTGTTTGSQADPGHKEAGDPGYKGEDGANNGPGTGDADAPSCPNDKSSVNGDVDNGKGGANGSGPYDSTCDGDNSENGQGSAAPGKGTPCAGCVGNADDKQPPGQVKEFEGQKANDMGYECDGNQGVGAHYGRGNPAHTGDCGSAPPPEECPTDMNPNMPGKQCTAPPPCTDNPNTPKDECDEDEEDCPGNSGSHNPNCQPPCQDDTSTPEDECEEGEVDCSGDDDDSNNGPNGDCKEYVTICHVPGNSDKIMTIPKEALDGHLGHGDFLWEEGMTCGDTPPPPDCSGDDDDSNNGSNGDCKEYVTICHVPGNSNQVMTIPAEALGGHLGHGDFLWVEGISCDGPPPPPDCSGDHNPNNNGPNGDCTYPPPVCPDDSEMPGQPVPGGNVNNCYPTNPPPLCPAGSDMPGQPVPGGNVNNCYRPPLCPAGSDFPGQPMPSGDIRNCYVNTPPPTTVCPAGTDRAGQPMPDGDIRNCNDDVLGEIIDKEKPGGDVLGDRDGGAAERPATRGRILPFTGASLLAYLVLALELLGAGALILRARKR